MTLEYNSRRRALRDAFRSRKNIFATWTSFGDCQITEIFANTKCDFVGIDIEHGTSDYQQCQRIIAAAQAGGSLCLPRVASHNMEMIKRLLDSGADGIILPMVENTKDVENFIKWTKYAPTGLRSFGVNRAQNYGFDFDAYASEWNDVSSMVIQIESIEGVENIERLLAYDEIDAAMVGPYDLSGSLGIPGQIEHPKVQEAAKHVIEACKKAGKSCGSQVVDYEAATIEAKQAEGYNFLVLSSDVFLIWKWAEHNKELISKFR